MRKETGTLEGRQAIVSAEWCGREPVAEETRTAAGQQRSSNGAAGREVPVKGRGGGGGHRAAPPSWAMEQLQGARVWASNF